MTVHELDNELKRLRLGIRHTGYGLALTGDTQNATPELIGALKKLKPYLMRLLDPIAKQCPGFTVQAGKRLRTERCGAWFRNEADCAMACHNRHCPQKKDNA